MSTGERPSRKGNVSRRLLKVAEWTDSGRLFQREGAHELKALIMRKPVTGQHSDRLLPSLNFVVNKST